LTFYLGIFSALFSFSTVRHRRGIASGGAPGSVSTPVSTSCFSSNFLQADFLAIATQGLVNVKYWGSQILLCTNPLQRGIGAGFCCPTGLAIVTQRR
jgi:hypothetical protein